MAIWRFRARDASGRLHSGTLQADTARHARQQLRERGWLLTRLDQQQAFGMAFGPAPLRRGELALLTRQLATLVQAGLALEQALQAVAEQSARPSVCQLLLAVRARVLEGQTLGLALGQFPRAFSELFRTTVAAGERAGQLDRVLEQLADYTEARQEAHQRLQMALVYPCILLLASTAIVGFLLGYVVPDVVGLFADSGRPLPALTQGLIMISHATRSHGWLAMAALVVFIIGLRQGLRRPAWRWRWHALWLRVAIVGAVWRASEAARFASTLAILGASAVPLVEALRIAAGVVGNQCMRQRLVAAAQQVSEGETLTRSLAASGDIPPLMLHLIASGERAGDLDRMLERAANQQEKILAARLAMVLGLFEPLMLVVMGGVVLLIVLAILLPILSLNQLVT